jgi:OOP family OmpA-OmpF porin
MKSKDTRILLIACAITLALSGAVFGQDSVALSVAPSALRSFVTGGIAEGQRLKVEGIVINRNEESFTVRETKGTEMVVIVTDKTEIKKERRGWFHRDRASSADEIRRGLRLKVEGRGNSDGQLVARNITFDEQDLKTAEALESRVDPVENLANSTQALAENNQTRITESERRLDQAEQNALRLGGQVEELSTVANAAVSAAKAAQSAADQAEADATTANERIGALDDYEAFIHLAVYFKTGSAVLSPSAKEALDQAATYVSGANLKGWVVAVEGFADSTGRTATNHSLSQRRAQAVIDYLVTKHGLPPRRVIQPFGYDSMYPVVANNTGSGRSANRRAQITVLVNKGISSQASSQQTSSQELLSPQP